VEIGVVVGVASGETGVPKMFVGRSFYRIVGKKAWPPFRGVSTSTSACKSQLKKAAAQSVLIGEPNPFQLYFRSRQPFVLTPL